MSPTGVVVTIILPTIGRPSYIVNTVRSILAQSYPNIQILISDNAASVATIQLLAKAGISDPRIDIAVRPIRLSFSSHMNACIEDARGTYIMILSDDDQITSGYVEEMVLTMDSNPEVAVCLGRQTQIGENDMGVMPDKPSGMSLVVLDGPDFIGDSLSGKIKTGVLTSISMFVRKTDMIQVGSFSDYPDGLHVDNLVIFKLALRGKIALASSLMYYRVYSDSFGLSAPFQNLLAATYAYNQDCSNLLRAEPLLSEGQKKFIMQSLKSNNVRLLLSRIRRVYRFQLSPFALLVCLLQVAQFKLASMNAT